LDKFSSNEIILAKFGVGHVYTTNREDTKTDRNIVQYRVQGVKDCLKVRDFFTPLTFETPKGEDFKLWSNCLDLMEKGEHLTNEGLLKICELRDKMNFRKTKNKWSTEEILKVLEEKPLHVAAHFDAKQQQLIHNNIGAQDSWLTLKQGNSKPNRFVVAQN